jgi:methylglyoxal synthase
LHPRDTVPQLKGHRADAYRSHVNGRQRIALIAHDGQKQDMIEWAVWNRALLRDAELCGTRHTAKLVSDAIGAPVRALLSGPRGGDAQVGAMIAKRELDLVVFFWDPLESHAHEADVRALLRLAVLHDLPIACNRRSADLIVTSRLWKDDAAVDVPA